MIEQGLFKTHFLGRDGFVWWIGQIAPKKTWQQNFGDGKAVGTADEIKGVGERYRVRIMGYHTANKDELPDDELPFATVMYPVTAGSGGASSQNSNLAQGNFVFGFFLDGEDAQQPVIMGCIGYNEYQKVMNEIPSIGFKPFYGLDGPKPGAGKLVVKQPNDLQQTTSTGTDTATTDATSTSAQATDKVGVAGHKYLTGVVDKKASDDPTESQAVPINSPDRNEIPLAGIQKSLSKAIQQIEQLKKSIRELGAEQSARIGNLKSEINKRIDEAAEWVAAAIKWVYEMIEEHVFNKLDDGFKAIFAAAKPNEREKVKATTGSIMDNLACMFRALFAKLMGMVRDFIAEAIEKVVNVPVCFVEKFVGNVLGTISGVLDGALSSVQSAIDGVVDFAVEGLDLAGDVMGFVGRILSTLQCDIDPENSPVSEWSLINGGKQPITQGNIANIINRAKAYGEKAKKFPLDQMDKFDLAQETDFSELFNVKDLWDSCSTDEFPCGPPKLNIFGSKKGAGAAGNLVVNAAGEVIGVDMKSFGVGYDEDTRAVVWDDCGKGRGAVIRPIMGDVFNNFQTPRNNNGRNKGTPEFAPASLGFGPFAATEYEFSEDDDSSIVYQPYSPDYIAYGTPQFGLGPSVSLIGKGPLKTRLGVGTENIGAEFGQEIFTLPVVDRKVKVNVKFILQAKTAELNNVSTDFDFANDDASGRGKLKDDQIYFRGQTVGELFKADTLVRKGSEDPAYKKSKKHFRELFAEGQRQRVVEEKRYEVRGFQKDGEALLKPIKISPDGKCILVYGVTGRKLIKEPRTRTVEGAPSRRFIHFDFGNRREQRAYDRDPIGFWADKLEKNDTSIRLKDGSGDDRNATFFITNNGDVHDDSRPNRSGRIRTEAKFLAGTFEDSETKKTHSGLFIEGMGKVWLRLAYDDDPDVAQIAIDRITIDDDDGVENIWQQTMKGTRKPNDGDPHSIIDEGEDAQDNNSIRLHPRSYLEKYYVDVYTQGESDDVVDMVLCCKYGKFKKGNRKLQREGGVIYIFKDREFPSPGPDDEEPITLPPVDPPRPPAGPVLPVGIPIPTGGGSGGGIPGILTPLPGARSTFHPFPGSTTLGPGKWHVGPIPPGGGGPHVGPAVFVHNKKLEGVLTGTKGTPFESTQKQKGGSKKTGGGGATAEGKTVSNDVYVFGQRTGGVNKWGMYEDGTYNKDIWGQVTKGSKIPKYLKAPKTNKSGGAGGGKGEVPKGGINVYGFNNPTNPVFFQDNNESKIPQYLKAQDKKGKGKGKKDKEGGYVNEYGFNNPDNPVFGIKPVYFDEGSFGRTSDIPEYLKNPKKPKKPNRPGGFEWDPKPSPKPGGFEPPSKGPGRPGGFKPTPVPVPPPGGFEPSGPGGFEPSGPGAPPADPGGLPQSPTAPSTPHPGPVPPGPGTWYPNTIPDPEIPPGAVPLDVPGYPGTLVPGDSGGYDGPGLGVVDIDVIQPGGGYLPSPDGSTGGDGRTYSGPNDTRITYGDGRKELPIPPDNRICVEAGDTVILPLGTRVVTEPFDGVGGGEVIIGGGPHIMRFPGCFTTPAGGEKPKSQNTYPVLMYLCDVFIKHPGSGYKNTDKVVIEPSMGASAEVVVDKFGRISDVIIIEPGEGFQVIPTITIQSATGQNAQLRAKLCIDRVGEVVPEDQEKVIQVVDCVGTFPL